MNYVLVSENSFKKDYKRCKRRNYNLGLLHQVMSILGESGDLPVKIQITQIKRQLYKSLGMSHKTGLVVDLETGGRNENHLS